MMNILKNKLIRSLFSSTTYPLIAQIVLLVCFVVLIYGGIVIPDVDENLVKILRNTNFSALFMVAHHYSQCDYFWPSLVSDLPHGTCELTPEQDWA